MTTISTSVPRLAAGDAPVAPPPRPPPASAVWQAMVGKEWREMGVIAAVMALTAGAVLGWMLTIQSRTVGNPYSTSRNYDTAGDVFITGTMALLAPLAALLLGFWQFMVESRPDRFGFVVHRPVSRARLFACKVAAGLGLYLVALLVPVLGALVWASRPANLPLPFTWNMGLPAVADVLSGIPFYFAGILVARRTEAWWIGSRLLPAAAPIFSAAGNFAANSFGWAVLFTVIGAAVMVVPARSAYLAGGQYRGMGRVPRAALGLTMLVVLLTLGGLGLSLAGELLRPWTDRAPGAGAAAEYTFEYQEFTRDGVPFVVWQSEPGKPLRVTDLQKNVMQLPVANTPDIYQIKMGLSQLSWTGMSYSRDLHYPQRYFQSVMYMPDRTEWHFPMTDNGGDYLVGFNPATRERVGAIGADGLEPGVAVPRARLAKPVNVMGARTDGGPSRGMTRWISAGDTLYRLTPALALEPMYRSPAPILALTVLYPEGNSVPSDSSLAQNLVVQTDRDVMILTTDAKPQVRLAYAVDNPQDWKVEVGQIPASGRYLLQLRWRWEDRAPTGKSRVVYFDAAGAVDHVIELPDFAHTWVLTPGWLETYVLPVAAPPALVDIGTMIDTYRQAQWPGLLSSEQMAQAEYARRIEMILATITALACAAAMWLLAAWRKLPRGARWLWTVLALLLGPVSFPLLLCTRGLGVLVPCPACGKRSLVEAAACPHCRAARAVPAQNGTEIL